VCITHNRCYTGSNDLDHTDSPTCRKLRIKHVDIQNIMRERMREGPCNPQCQNVHVPAAAAMSRATSYGTLQTNRTSLSMSCCLAESPRERVCVCECTCTRYISSRQHESYHILLSNAALPALLIGVRQKSQCNQRRHLQFELQTHLSMRTELNTPIMTAPDMPASTPPQAKRILMLWKQITRTG